MATFTPDEFDENGMWIFKNPPKKTWSMKQILLINLILIIIIIVGIYFL